MIISRSRLAISVAVAALALTAGASWIRQTQPIATAKHLVEASNGLAGKPVYLDVFKVPKSALVCGAYRSKGPDGVFGGPQPFIVWFQTADAFSWRDAVMLRPTRPSGWAFRTGDQIQDAMRNEADKAGLAAEAADNRFYQFAPACDAALKARRAS